MWTSVRKKSYAYRVMAIRPIRKQVYFEWRNSTPERCQA